MAVTFVAITLTVPLDLFIEEGKMSKEYLERRYEEKEIIERFSDWNFSFQDDVATISSSRGCISSHFEEESLVKVEADLVCLSSPVHVNYRFDKNESLDYYSNGWLTLEQKITNDDTLFIVNGETAFTMLSRGEKFSYVFLDGETDTEEKFGNGEFKILRGEKVAFSGIDGKDGMLKCDSAFGLKEEWTYDKKGFMASYRASDGTKYTKTGGRGRPRGIEVEALGQSTSCCGPRSDERNLRVCYSKGKASVESFYNADSSIRHTNIRSDCFSFDMATSIRKDVPSSQIGSVISPRGVYEAFFDRASRVKSMTFSGGLAIAYEYDALGRLISSRGDKGHESHYEYDDANNMTKAITRHCDVTYEYLYTYMNDRLESFNGEAVTYDKNGNIATYGENIFRWEVGSIMTKAIRGESEYSLRYDAMKNPIVKETGSRTVSRMIWEGMNLSAVACDEGLLVFLYDFFNNPIGFCSKDHLYAYCKNTFQDVVAIVRDDGKLVAEYSYGDFGEPEKISDCDGSGIAFANPLRYRSYIYDQDLGLYYVGSRWYSPELRRFLNPESPRRMMLVDYQSELILNRYSYCGNDPISHIDRGFKTTIGLPSDILGPFSHPAPAISVATLIPLPFVEMCKVAFKASQLANEEANNQKSGGTPPCEKD